MVKNSYTTSVSLHFDESPYATAKIMCPYTANAAILRQVVVAATAYNSPGSPIAILKTDLLSSTHSELLFAFPVGQSNTQFEREPNKFFVPIQSRVNGIYHFSLMESGQKGIMAPSYLDLYVTLVIEFLTE